MKRFSAPLIALCGVLASLVGIQFAQFLPTQLNSYTVPSVLMFLGVGLILLPFAGDPGRKLTSKAQGLYPLLYSAINVLLYLSFGLLVIIAMGVAIVLLMEPAS